MTRIGYVRFPAVNYIHITLTLQRARARAICNDIAHKWDIQLRYKWHAFFASIKLDSPLFCRICTSGQEISPPSQLLPIAWIFHCDCVGLGTDETISPWFSRNNYYNKILGSTPCLTCIAYKACALHQFSVRYVTTRKFWREILTKWQLHDVVNMAKQGLFIVLARWYYLAYSDALAYSYVFYIKWTVGLLSISW